MRWMRFWFFNFSLFVRLGSPNLMPTDGLVRGMSDDGRSPGCELVTCDVGRSDRDWEQRPARFKTTPPDTLCCRGRGVVLPSPLASFLRRSTGHT
jgi:hypothetical protein